ncbi:acyl-CoA dehydrogenase family protein [Nocardia veterana]|uniref:Acyl-CoA/acyl-ACP dehydrogenase n=1 Tax=Nocardia veterana TaxID=132249 RepID=A0A7X6M2Z6_9NOCA|nr:acyl-CoA dehydrogenase family protein [Nocardia veterana]NKY89291.1 acyl-CoA/acyl-ACP dehydrogenase [Nocardia veterana]
MTVTVPARAAVAAFVRERAAALDAGTTDVRVDLAEIGRSELLALALGETDISEFAVVIEEVAAESLAAGFSLWAQRMTLEYVWRAPEPVRRCYLDGLASGRTVGVTAMAAALKHLAGLGELPLRAEPGDDRAVSGSIAWASNVFEDALIVFPYRGADRSGRVAVVAAGADGVLVRPAPELLALNATGSTGLTFDRVEVPDDQLITTDLPRFGAAIRPIFLLLQTAFCSGVAGRSVAEAGARLTGLGDRFRGDHGELTARHRSVRQRLYAFAADPGRVAPAELIRVRLDASRVAVDATRLESTLRGGAGFARDCDTNRRFREAAFLPVQSPSEGQLRWELSQYD